MTRRHIVIIAAFAAALLGIAVPSWAYFTASATSIVSAGATTLAPVTNVTAVATDSADATVSWTLPTPANPSATTYTATSSPGSKSCTGTNISSCVVGGLTAGTPYTFAVVPTLHSWSAAGTSTAGSTTPPASVLTLAPESFATLPQTETGTLTGFPAAAALSWYLDSPGGTTLSGTSTLPANNAVSVTVPTGTAAGSHVIYVVSGTFSASTGVSYNSGPAPSAPTSVSLANGGGTGNAYVNSANKSSINVSVALPSTSKSTDVVHLTAGDGTNTVTPATMSGTSGTGTVTFVGLNLSSFNDGPVTFTTWVTNASGTSANTVKAVTKDTVNPSAPTASYTDGNNGQGDKITGVTEVGATITAVETAPATKTWTTTAATTSYSLKVDNLSTHSGINYSYSVTATDAAGNVSPATIVSGTDNT